MIAGICMPPKPSNTITQSVAVLSVLAGFAALSPYAHAQDLSRPSEDQPTTTDAPSPAADEKIGFAADALEYDTHSQIRSEEPTSELQSLMRTSYAHLCLKNIHIHINT